MLLVPLSPRVSFGWIGLLVTLGCCLVGTLAPLRSAAAPATWVRVDAPMFRIYAEASEKQALAWARDFEIFRDAVDTWINVGPTQLRPAHIVLFRDERSFKPFIPLRDGKRMEVGSYSFSAPGLPTVIATHRDLTTTGSGRESLYFGGVGWLLTGFEAPGPDWLRTGLSEVFSTFEIQTKRYRIGRAQDQTARYLTSSGVPDLSELLATDRASLRYRGDTGTQVFHAHSWVVVHYLMFGAKNARAGRMGEVLRSMNQGRTAAEAITDVFEKPPRWFDSALANYIRGGTYLIFHAPIEEEKLQDLFKVSRPSPAEVAVARGHLYLQPDRFDDAARLFGEAELLDPQLPEVQVAWGDLAALRNNPAEALRRYELAAAAGSTDARIYFALGDALVRTGAIGAGDGGVPRFEGAAARRAANHLERSINLYPYYVPAYARLVALLPSVNRITEHDRAFIETGLRLRPKDPLLHVGLALIELRLGQTDTARQRFEEVARLDPQYSALSVALAREQLAQLTIGGDFIAARTALDAGRIEEAERLINNLIEMQQTPAQRREVIVLRKELTRHTQLRRATQHLEAGRWRDALVLLEALAEDANLPAELRTQVDALIDRAKGFEKRV